MIYMDKYSSNIKKNEIDDEKNALIDDEINDETLANAINPHHKLLFNQLLDDAVLGILKKSAD